MNEILQRLLSPEFAVSIGVTSSPQEIRRALAASGTVRELRQAIRGGLITESELRHFVDSVSAEFVKGERFPYEAALAALAFVLETRKTHFADEYLLDLARLDRFSEFVFAPQVAALCRQRWSRIPTTKSLRATIPLHSVPEQLVRIFVVGLNKKRFVGTKFDSLETA